jgi:hypothetical protein
VGSRCREAAAFSIESDKGWRGNWRGNGSRSEPGLRGHKLLLHPAKAHDPCRWVSTSAPITARRSSRLDRLPASPVACWLAGNRSPRTCFPRWLMSQASSPIGRQAARPHGSERGYSQPTPSPSPSRRQGSLPVTVTGARPIASTSGQSRSRVTGKQGSYPSAQLRPVVGTGVGGEGGGSFTFG